MMIRVSSTGQAEGGYSLESQTDMLRDIIRRYHYEPFAEVLEDDGYSGDNWNRPAVKRGLELLRSGQVRSLAWISVDRFARDSPGGRNYIEQVLKAKGELIFGDIGKYSGDVNFRFMLDMKLVISEHEKRVIAERTSRGTRKKVQLGFINSSYAPYGYQLAAKEKVERGALAIDPEQAKVVREIFQLADMGLSLRALARELVARGVPPARTAWSAGQISRILSDEVYCGKWHYNKRQAAVPQKLRKLDIVRHRERSSQVWRPREEWLAVDVPAIITDRALFDRVQKRMQQNKALMSGRISDKYLLRSLVWCGECKGRHAGYVVRQNTYYRCANRDRLTGDRLCSATSVRAEVLEAVVWKAMIDTLSNPKAMKAQLAAQEANRLAAMSPSRRDLLQQTILEAQSKIDRARQGVMVTPAADLEGQRFFMSALEEWTARRDQAQAELSRQAAPVIPIKTLEAVAQRAALEFKRCGQTATRLEKQELLRKWVARITYTQGDVEIAFRIPTMANSAAGSAPDGSGNCINHLSDCDSFSNLFVSRRVA
jgi:site-specific DNA recombinase